MHGRDYTMHGRAYTMHVRDYIMHVRDRIYVRDRIHRTSSFSKDVKFI